MTKKKAKKPTQNPVMMTTHCCANCKTFRISKEEMVKDARGTCTTRGITVHITDFCALHKLGLPPEQQFKKDHGFVEEPPSCRNCKHGAMSPLCDDWEAGYEPVFTDETECHHPDLGCNRMTVLLISVCGHHERGDNKE